MVEISYCTREQVQDTLPLADSTRLNPRIDAAIKLASRDIEGLCHRFFYPTTATYLFDQPSGLSLFLNQYELGAAPTLVTSGGVTMTAADYILRPVNRPPYQWIDVNEGGQNYWTSQQTTQNATSITSDAWGYPANVQYATDVAVTASAGATALDIADSSAVGVGQLILAGTERIVVTEKTYITTTATITASLAANKGEVAVSVSNGTLIKVGERIRIDGELMRVEAIAGNVLYVTRALGSSVLAAHTSGATVFAPRRLTVARGQLGTVATTQTSTTPVYNLLSPSLVTEYVVAAAEVAVSQGASGYARPVGGGTGNAGSGGNAREPVGAGLEALAERVYTRYGRKARMRTVGA
jgi:hypothetical protein